MLRPGQNAQYMHAIVYIRSEAGTKYVCQEEASFESESRIDL